MSIPAVFKKKFKNMSSNLAHPCSFHLCAEQRTGFLQSIDHSLCLWRYALSILRGTAARDGQSRLRRLAFFLRMGNCTYMYLWTWKLSYYIIFIFLLYTIVTWHNFWCEQFERKKNTTLHAIVELAVAIVLPHSSISLQNSPHRLVDPVFPLPLQHLLILGLRSTKWPYSHQRRRTKASLHSHMLTVLSGLPHCTAHML